ncbi:MAG: 3-deoxy-7-phosphoheptulonate synthase [Clostridia bacterium]|nr:3-deoxy-7-phosphoheptulonate synthase [Clostridia bacterium]
MIIKFKKNTLENSLERLKNWLLNADIEFKEVILNGIVHIITSSGWKDVAALADYREIIDTIIDFDTEYQISTRKYQQNNTVINLGDDLVFGANKTIMMAGPCAVESEDQVMRTAEFLSEKCNIKVFRAGAYKPRTSPYTFQGLEEKGLKILDKVRNEFGMKIITEVKDNSHLDEVADCADIIQIGTKSMYIFNLLSRCGRINKPVLLKRAFMATIKEFLQAADFILSNGNPNVILCERGIRTFEPQTRFSLDVCSTALLKEISHLPIVLDPSHAMGRAAQVPLVGQAAAAMEVDGLLIETHPNPSEAKSDKNQALSFEQFEKMMNKLKPICKSIKRQLV